MITFVYFDLGGVLIDFRGFLEWLADQSGKPLARVVETFQKYDSAVCRGDLAPHELWHALRHALEITAPRTMSLDQHFLAHCTPIADGQALIRQVAERYKVGILSNNWGSLPGLQKLKGLIPNLPYVAEIHSCHVGRVKPTLAMYALATERAGVDRHAILLIDDSAVNTAAAIDFGWQALQFQTGQPQASAAQVREVLGLASG